MTNLFILPTRLGDTIFTTGVIDTYKDQPSTIIASSITAPLFSDMPNLEKLIVMGKKPYKKHWFELWKLTKSTQWNRIIDLRGSVLSYFLNAKNRQVWTQPPAVHHKVIQINRAMGLIDATSPTLWFSKERLAKTKLNKPTLAVAPIAGWYGKQWPIQHFIQLLTKFCTDNPNAQVALFAAPNEIDQIKPLLEALPKNQCINTVGQDLLDSAAMIKSSRLFIGNDSGLLHLSAAVNTPSIALFGPSNDKLYGPWSYLNPSPHTVLRSMPIPRKKIKQTFSDKNCYMEGLKYEDVEKTLYKKWE